MYILMWPLQEEAAKKVSSSFKALERSCGTFPTAQMLSPMSLKVGSETWDSRRRRLQIRYFSSVGRALTVLGFERKVREVYA